MRLTLKTPQTIESEEIRGLRGCLNDLMGLLTLPIVWRGREQDHVVATLLDAIRRVVELDFVYAHLSVPDGKQIEMIRIADSGNTNIDSDGLLLAIRRWLRNDTRTRSSALGGFGEGGDFRLAAYCLGADERTGVFVAGSSRVGFPSKSERLLLNVAANEAAVGLQEAQRKEELAIANQELTKQTEQREAAQEALRLVEGRLSQILQGAATEDARTSEVAELRKKYARLTPREREVLPFVVAGWLSKQTAAELGTSESTIRVHRGQIMRKMQAHSLAELIRMSDRLGIRRLSRAGVAGSG